MHGASGNFHLRIRAGVMFDAKAELGKLRAVAG